MAKRSSIEKQKRRERLVNLNWDKRQELKKKILNQDISDEDRQKAVAALNKMPKNGAAVRLRNRCLFTGRCRGYIRKFKVSRLVFREMASIGLIPGVTKASW